MTLHSQPVPPVPEQTAQVARAAFPKGNLYLRLRDELGSLYKDEMFAELYPIRGQSTFSPWRLALITVMQFLDNLSDRQAADAVRARIDWKYALSLDLTDSGFDYSVLSEFRARLVTGGLEAELLHRLLEECQSQGLIKSRSKQRTDSTHVLGAIRDLNRYEHVGEVLRHALNDLATVAPEWVKQVVRADWYERYSTRIESTRLPSKQSELQAWLLQVGQDGHHLLAQIYADATPDWMQQIPAVECLRQVWVQHYYLEGTQVRTRKREEMPPCDKMIESPYDVEARHRTKRSTHWTGYCVHLTETCEDDYPNLITNVETTTATVADVEVTFDIHESLATRDLSPSEHYFDTAYNSSEHLVHIPILYGTSIIAPVLPDVTWQARAQTGYDLSHFTIDWQNQQVTCPQGQVTSRWSEKLDPDGQDRISVRFSYQHCQNCSVRAECTTTKSQQGRALNLLPQAQHEALQAARQAQTTLEFQKQYARRAGVEGTISQGTHAFDLRRSRYIGLAKTHLQEIATATAMNVVRLWHWWNEIPKAQTRTSRFAALNPEIA
ncbi:IS1182 family transposase [Leptolyngbya boryana CZ1]|uniref:IS1182 family transposase n=1 Tax=Leptolyngbya boryana CZ1 TaxID=3060204 RepID=A0AA96WR93_LEPBY|nr:IS1182 family transposase [Leptolyngbya boryana]WNZ44068.1 IS1182 family transposase [Leptolyngbya boryana CZ1]